MKIRLNKKTIDELSAGQALSTLKTKQKQVEEDITTYIDEPFLKPENIRHGITMAGVEGKYAEVKYLNIYDVEGNHLRTLASTEPTPQFGIDGKRIILTNAPFEEQCASIEPNAGVFGIYSDKDYTNNVYEFSKGGSMQAITAPFTTASVVVVPKEVKEIGGEYSLQILSGAYYDQPYETGIGVAFNGNVYGQVPSNAGAVTYGVGELQNQNTAVNDPSWSSLPAKNGICEIFTNFVASGHDINDSNYNKFGYFLNTPGILTDIVESQIGSDTFRLLGISCDWVMIGEDKQQININFPSFIDLNDPDAAFYIDFRIYNPTDEAHTLTFNISREYGSSIINNSGYYVSEIGVLYGNCLQFNVQAERNPQQCFIDYMSVHFGTLNINEEMLRTITKESIDRVRYYIDPLKFPKVDPDTGDDYNVTYNFDEEVNIGETSKMWIKRNASIMDYHDYCNLLDSSNVKKVSEVSFNNSTVAVYETFSQRICVQCLYYDYTPVNNAIDNHYELRVIEDSRTGEFNKRAFSNNGYGHIQEYSHMPDDPVTFIMLSDNANSPSSQYATGDTYRWGGAMGFVFKLRDGKFFIIDGGIGGNNPAHTKYDSQAPILAAALKRYAPDQNNIKIAGWLLTHAHQDHVGVFCEFIEKPEYKSIISIDKVIYSLPVESFQCFKDARAAQTYKEFDEALNVLRAEGKTEIVKAHMGMKFNLGGLGLTILAAPENVYRSYDPDTGELISDFDNINDTCVLSKVEYAGKRLIFMADACDIQIGAAVMPLIANVIGEATALQVPHHGYADTKSSRLYTQIGQLTLESNLEFTIWPLCYEHFSGKQVNGEDYYEGGKKYNSVFAHSNNAALQNIQAIYPENNYSMVATSNTIGEWTFTAVDFVDPEPVWPNDSWTCPWCAFQSGGASSLLGPGTPQCPDCGYPYLGKCISCGKSLIYGEDLHPPYCESCYNSGAGGPRCADCGASFDPENGPSTIYCEDCYNKHNEGGGSGDSGDGGDDSGGESVASCKYCGEDENNTDLPALECCPTCQEYFHYTCGGHLVDGTYYCEECAQGDDGQDTPHDYCAHCGTGIYGAEYTYCDRCGMICSNCTECGNCYVAACGADTRSKCILCGNYYCGYHSSGQNDGKCLRCKGIEFS